MILLFKGKGISKMKKTRNKAKIETEIYEGLNVYLKLSGHPGFTLAQWGKVKFVTAMKTLIDNGVNFYCNLAYAPADGLEVLKDPVTGNAITATPFGKARVYLLEYIFYNCNQCERRIPYPIEKDCPYHTHMCLAYCDTGSVSVEVLQNIGLDKETAQKIVENKGCSKVPEKEWKCKLMVEKDNSELLKAMRGEK